MLPLVKKLEKPTLRQTLRRAFRQSEYRRFLMKDPGYRRRAYRLGLEAMPV